MSAPRFTRSRACDNFSRFTGILFSNRQVMVVVAIQGGVSTMEQKLWRVDQSETHWENVDICHCTVSALIKGFSLLAKTNLFWRYFLLRLFLTSSSHLLSSLSCARPSRRCLCEVH